MKKILLPLLLLIANIGFSQVDLNLGLRAYYPFSGNANDISGNNNNPSFNNATLTADRFGNPNSAYHFNGTNNYMQIPNSTSLNMPNKMSVALWVKPTGYYTGQCYNNMLVTKSTTFTTGSNFYVRFADVYNGCTSPTTTDERFSGNDTVAPTPLVQLNQWYSVVWTSDGVLERIYVNCELKVTALASGVPFSNALNMFFGKNSDPAFPYWLNGDLDEIRIYDRALNQDEVSTLGGCTLTTTCNNWLSTPTYPSYATAGDIDVTGNQITVEATFNRTAPLNGGLYPGHLVSKHTNVSDVNYALFPNGCSITTTNGYKETFETCGLALNKTYHVAMVYDGSFLKFYRNGFLITQVACTGNMITNNLLTTIAQYAGGANATTQFLGNVNEVRIWNVARTQAQLQTYMNSSLPNPPTQTGLQAYYSFNNLVNQQGNNTFNAVLQGGATTNATNPNCTFVADSCVVPVNCGNWLRTQAVGQSVTVGDLDISGNQVTVEANFNCSSFPLTRPDKQEDIVSKHANTTDINYVLRMDLAGITTTNGQFITPLPCDNLVTNKTYHVAMVYNGSSLKFYRDGFLMSQIPATGNLILNNWQTTIGDYAVNNPVGTNFLGYINEVRIWNVARTQAQIRTYMDASLPNPTTQAGLQGYYTFDNLLNKQGNAAWNGTLNGGATINNTNPNCAFVADSCNVTPPPPVCNSSFELAKPNNSYVRILPAAPATYNQLYNSNGFSWETWFKLTGPITNLSTLISAEDALLFHDIFLGFGWGSIPNALCFLVSDNGAANATVFAESAQSLTVGTWYHVAAVCDYSNAILRLYLNGTLIATKPIPIGILNDRLTTNVSTQLGNASSSLIYGINANIDETRFWNTVRSQAEIQASMNQCLSNPQPGLVAYFKADELVGTTAASAVNNNFSGSLSNTIWGTQTPSVNCGCVTQTSVIINAYTPVLGFNPCDNKLTVEDGTAYNVGDTVLLIQMKGAVIDSTNTAAFGTITDYKNAGNYEYNYVKSKTGNVIELKNVLTRQYDIPVGKVQLIRVPYYNSLTTTDTLTCLPWDGNKGGVLVFNVQNTLTLNADVNVSGKGFRGGVNTNVAQNSLACNQVDYYYNTTSTQSGKKGEGIALLGSTKLNGKGKSGNGGGGGNGHNSGGGGGSNASLGGLGGYQLDNCGGAPFDNRGIGGQALTYNNALNKIFLGGGGGAAHYDGAFGSGFYSNGGNGGGIVLINAGSLVSNNHTLTAKGMTGEDCLQSGFPCNHDGMAGGGAGGSVILGVNTFIDNNVQNVAGGKGANLEVYSAAAGKVGPGGGGSGGVVWFKSAALPANSTVQNTGGVNGVIVTNGNNPWGATPGSNGVNLFNLVLPVSTVPFKPNIDSVRIKDSVTACLDVDFKGFAYTNTNPISTWQWYFGDAGTANTQNTSHTYAAAGTFIVKLVVTDINGCKDSILKSVTVDVCSVLIINDYTPVLGFNPCDNKLTVEDGTAYNVGDTVLLIQMKGAVIDATNTAAFGTITDYKNAGNYEFNYVKSRAGNVIELKNTLTRQYDIPVGKVQLIRVPYYTNLVTSDILTCLPWDGNKGGVLVFNVQNALTLNNNIDVSGKGFSGGIDPVTNPPVFNCNENQFYYPANPDLASGKGEGIANISAARSFGKGALANGGGGGNSHNSGGAGGGNISAGGFGGYQFEGSPCNGTVPFDNRGISGKALTYSNAANKIFLGGGGGAGHTNNPEAFQAKGGNGAGIIIVSANSLTSNTKKIVANGNEGARCGSVTSGCHEGMGGGGAAGTVLLQITNYVDNTTIESKGGKGADMTAAGFGKVGPGGGGSGGPVWLSNASLPANVTVLNTAGINGGCVSYANDAWGATAGTIGQNLFNLVLPVDLVPFKTNIDSVRIKDSIMSCNDFDFKGLAYINTNPIASWQWYFGDGGQANTQNTSHAYGSAGLYTVKLIVTDINGCIDSVLKDVNALPAVTANAGTDISVCSNSTVSVTLNGTAVGGPYLWSPAIYLNNPAIQNPTATINSTTTFYLNVIGSATCTAIDSVTVYINPVPLVDTRPDTAICRLSPLVLNTNSNATTFQWSPAGNVSNPAIANPNFIGNASGWMYVTGSFASGCSAIDSLYVTVNPIPFVDTRTDTAICRSSPLVLNTNSDATSYQWSPAASVSNPIIASPNYISNSSGWVYVTGYFASGCSARDSLYVTVNPVPFVDTRTDTAICRFSPLVLNTNSDATIFQWSPAGNVSNPTIANPNYTGSASGWIYVTGSTVPGCFAKDSLYVTVNPLPVVQTIADTTLCQSENVTLTTTGAQTYSWSPAIGLSNPAIASPVFIGSTGQNYTVTGTDANGCKNTDLVNISVILPGTFKAPPAFTICQKESVMLDGNNGTQVSYLWSPATYLSNATIINPLANPPQTTVYTLLVTDNRCGFDSTFTTLLTVVPAPVINARKSNDIDCALRSATLFASGGNQYLWSPSTGLNNPTIANPVAIPANTQTYTVLVTNATGCSNTDSVTVFFKTAASLARYMPNAFTPNGDRINDCYGLKNWIYIQKLQFYIFNRYGEQVFATANPNACWDGTYKGKPALAGTYVYVIKAQTDCGLEEQKGNFILIR